MVEPLVVSPSGVDAIALGDNAAFEHNGVLVQHDGIGAGDVGRSLAFVRDPRFVGTGFFAGEAPDGLTTVYGDPISADVFVYWRDPDDPMAQEVLVGATKSAPDGTWCITGLNYNLRYVIRARASGRDDVTVVGVQPSRTDVITYEGEFTNTEDFDGVAGEILITSGLPPFTATVIQPLPSGLFPVVSGRNLIIDGTTNADEVASFDVKVTSSNGAEKIIPLLQIVFGFKAPQNFALEVIINDDVFSVALTWKVASSTQQVKVYRSKTPFDMGDLPVPLAVLTGSATTYTDDDVVEDEVFYYMVSAEREGYVRYSVVVREVITSGDPHWDKVVTLLHFDGSFADETGRIWTPLGGAANSEDEYKFGSGSLYVPGGTRSGLYHAHSSDFALSSDDFTVEFQAFFLETYSRIALEIGSGSGWYGRFWIDSYEGKLRIAGGRSVATWVHNGDIPLNSWVHIAATIQSGQLRGFLNGILVGSANVSGQLPTGNLAVGIGYVLPQSNPSNMYGYIDELRITKGVARYTANFTPPTEPFRNR